VLDEVVALVRVSKLASTIYTRTLQKKNK